MGRYGYQKFCPCAIAQFLVLPSVGGCCPSVPGHWGCHDREMDGRRARGGDSVWRPISLAPKNHRMEGAKRGGYIYCSLTPHNYYTLVQSDSKSSFMCTAGEMDSQLAHWEISCAIEYSYFKSNSEDPYWTNAQAVRRDTSQGGVTSPW